MTVFEQRTHEQLQRASQHICDLTLRDLFAMSVIQTQVKDCLYEDEEIEAMAEQSYRVADAMLKARGTK